MREVKRSATVSQPQSRIYALINDVERYPEFVPGCTEARVEARTTREVLATLTVRRGPLRVQFTTRNELEPERRIYMRLVRGPFHMLEGEWLLTSLEDGGCRIDVCIRFAFTQRFAGALFEPFLQDTVASLVDAFLIRARAPDPLRAV